MCALVLVRMAAQSSPLFAEYKTLLGAPANEADKKEFPSFTSSDALLVIDMQADFVRRPRPISACALSFCDCHDVSTATSNPSR